MTSDTGTYHTARKAGRYIVEFDNGYSLFADKRVLLRYEIAPPPP